MSEQILFVKGFYESDGSGGEEHKCSLKKKEIGWNPPILNTSIILPNGEEFFVERIVQDLKEDSFIVYEKIIFQYYEPTKLLIAVKEHMEKGWKK